MALPIVAVPVEPRPSPNLFVSATPLKATALRIILFTVTSVFKAAFVSATPLKPVPVWAIPVEAL